MSRLTLAPPATLPPWPTRLPDSAWPRKLSCVERSGNRPLTTHDDSRALKRRPKCRDGTPASHRAVESRQTRNSVGASGTASEDEQVRIIRKLDIALVLGDRVIEPREAGLDLVGRHVLEGRD